MKSKTFLRIIWVASIASLIFILGFYLATFYSYKISSDPVMWGQFGDYIGGTLNPIFSLLNLFVLAFLTLKISQIENKRNKFTLQELARPLGDIHTVLNITYIGVNFKNAGLGPLIMTSITFLFEGKKYDSIQEYMPKMPVEFGKIHYEFFYRNKKVNTVIAKDDKINIFSIGNKVGDPHLMPFFESLYNTVYKTIIIIEYTDIYDRPMKTYKYDFSTAKHLKV